MTLELGPGTVLGRYELLAPVAKGGMAQVWMARLHGSRGFHKLVAVKTILTPNKRELRSEAMLLEEARLAALIHHSNIVTTLDLGEEQELLYLVMEWVHGETLRDVFHRALTSSGGMPLSIAVNVIAQACKGLHAAHEVTSPSGVPLHLVHRDISPQNLLLSYSGVVKVADFGIAKAMATTAELTQPGELKGKVTFMSPEQLACEPVDRRSDVFAMGTLLYMVTTGHHPFRGPTTAKTVSNIESCNPPRPSAIVRDFPADLDRVLSKALAKDPAQRYQTAAAMFEALVETQHGRVGQFEGALANYMRQVMGTKERERLELIQRCQSASAPVLRPSAPPPAAPPAAPQATAPLAASDRITLVPGPLPQVRDSQPPPAESLGPTVIRTEAAAEEGPSTSTLVSSIRGRQRRRWIAALTVSATVALGVVGARLNSVQRYASDGAAAAAPLPAIAHAEAARPLPAAVVATLAAVTDAPVDNTQGALAKLDLPTAPSAAAPREPDVVQPDVVQPVAIEVPSVVIAMSAPPVGVLLPQDLPTLKRRREVVAPPPSETRPAAAPNARSVSGGVNAWDRNQFGGRN